MGAGGGGWEGGGGWGRGGCGWPGRGFDVPVQLIVIYSTFTLHMARPVISSLLRSVFC